MLAGEFSMSAVFASHELEELLGSQNKVPTIKTHTSYFYTKTVCTVPRTEYVFKEDKISIHLWPCVPGLKAQSDRHSATQLPHRTGI
jgi:hypothetical protein